jgi:hypothetical protein
LKDCSFDELREQFRKIRLTSLQGPFPSQLPFENIIEKAQNGSQAILTVSGDPVDIARLESMAADMHCRVETLPLRLEDIYSLVIRERRMKTGEAR